MTLGNWIIFIILFAFVTYSEASSTKLNETRAILSSANIAINTFYLDIGRYPYNDEGLGVLIKNNNDIAGWQGPYTTKRGLSDAWRRPIIYNYDYKSQQFIVYSAGSNGIDEKGKGDDVMCTDVCDLKEFE